MTRGKFAAGVALLLAGMMLSGCGGSGIPDAAAGNDAQATLRQMSDQAFERGGGADWVQRWWKNGVENGAFIDTDPVKPASDDITVTFKSDYNDPGKSGTGHASGHALRVTIDGKAIMLTMVNGPDAGVPSLAGRRRCVIVSPDKAVYCTSN